MVFLLSSFDRVLLKEAGVCGNNDFRFKGSDRLCKVVELSMQSCGQIL